MILRVRIARSAIESLRDVAIGALVGAVLALVGLVWILGPQAVEFSSTLAKLLSK